MKRPLRRLRLNRTSERRKMQNSTLKRWGIVRGIAEVMVIEKVQVALIEKAMVIVVASIVKVRVVASNVEKAMVIVVASIEKARVVASEEDMAIVVGSVEAMIIEETEKDSVADRARENLKNALASHLLATLITQILVEKLRHVLRDLYKKNRVSDVAKFSAAIIPSSLCPPNNQLKA